MAEASMTSQQTNSLTAGADVSVFVRWRPLIKEEAGHEEITRTVTTEGAMQRVVFSGAKCLAGTNERKALSPVQANTGELTPQQKRMAKLAKRMRKREEKANTFNGVMNGVLEADQDNTAVYQQTVKPAVEHVLAGGIGAVFTYGQTGSGKTHTILGYGEEHGLAFQAMEEMQAALQKLNREDAFVNVTFTSMHKRSVYDLLNNRFQAAARENTDGEVVFRQYSKSKDKTRDDTEGYNVKQIRCKSIDEAQAAIQKGIGCRVAGKSNIHSQSSRSHAFLEYEISTERIEFYKRLVVQLNNEISRLVACVGKTVKPRCTEKGNLRKKHRYQLDQTQERNQIFVEFMTPEQLNKEISGKGYDGLTKWYRWLIKQVETRIEEVKAEEGPCFKGKMVLVDLAGSEHGADKRNNQQSAEEWQEAKQINISLSALNDVLYALHSGGKKRVAYRASILTRILRKYLSHESCKTVMIGNLSPSLIHSSKTMKTLRYCCMVAKAGMEH